MAQGVEVTEKKTFPNALIWRPNCLELFGWWLFPTSLPSCGEKAVEWSQIRILHPSAGGSLWFYSQFELKVWKRKEWERVWKWIVLWGKDGIWYPILRHSVKCTSCKNHGGNLNDLLWSLQSPSHFIVGPEIFFGCDNGMTWDALIIFDQDLAAAKLDDWRWTNQSYWFYILYIINSHLHEYVG